MKKQYPTHFERRSARYCHTQPRKGNVMVLTGVSLIAMLGMVAFAIDVGYITHAKTELQRTADASAMAAVLYLPNEDAARSAAETTAMQNYGTVGPQLEASDVEFGMWERDTATFISPAPAGYSTNAVRVTVKRASDRGTELRLFFAHVIGNATADVSASATVAYDENLCGPFIGIDWVSAPGSVVSDSYDSRKGPYNANTAGDRGSLCSDGPITLEGGVIINGDARSGKGHPVNIYGSPILTGSQGQRQKPLNLPPVDTSVVAASNDNLSLPLIQKGNSYLSPLDANGNFLLDGNKVYDIPPGDYYLNDLTLEGQAILNVTGKTNIYVTGNLRRAGGVSVNHVLGKSSQLRLFMTGGQAEVTSYDDFYGVIYAPNTSVRLDGSAHYFGAVVGKNLTVTGSSTGHYDEALDLSEVNLPRRSAIVD